MKNTFEAIYQKHEEIKARFQAAKAEKNVEAMEQARAEHHQLEESIELKGTTFATMYDLYKSARERGNEHIDISECCEYRNEAALIADFRECGIDTFTFSSSWSSAVESAWVFIQNGCSLMGMVEINAKTKNWEGDAYEKRHAYLFKVQ